MTPDERAHELALLLAEHHRIDPPGGKCTCGFETGLGELCSRHVADAVLAWLERHPEPT